MKQLIAIGFIALLAACPSKTKTDNPEPKVPKVFDAAPSDSGVWRPITRDKRLILKKSPADKNMKKLSETALQSRPMKIFNGTVGFGVFALLQRDGRDLAPPVITVKLVGMNKRKQWFDCHSFKPIVDGDALAVPEKRLSGGSSGSGGQFVLEHIDARITLDQLGAMAYATELKIQLCKDIIPFTPDEQKVLRAMYSELRSPSLE